MTLRLWNVFRGEQRAVLRGKEAVVWAFALSPADGNSLVAGSWGLTFHGNIDRAGYRSRYDEAGREVERTYLDDDGRPLATDGGFVGFRSRYDARGNEVQRTYLDRDGRPVLTKEHYATFVSEYDEQGNKVRFSLLDDAAHPLKAAVVVSNVEAEGLA